ncbi:hypothetical protein DHEL01_v208847 [Diaporthe helianthi]|uniref:Uncharacterized protein n=1 Tax=Diaporthe helianthi TaxID=158607 RepID=A0A2P5HR68_DIAHE|nr:hypothetical protein DHEL01_v208847 [Diaporthe helianthi]
MPTQTDGTQAPPRLADHQTIVNVFNFYGANPTMPADNNNNQTPAMPRAARGTNQGEQSAAQGNVLFAKFDPVHGDQDMNDNVLIRSQPGSLRLVQVGAQQPAVQRKHVERLLKILRAQNDLFAEMELPANAQRLLRVFGPNPFAMDGLLEICYAVNHQHAQNQQLVPQGGARQAHKNLGTPSVNSDDTIPQSPQRNDQDQHSNVPASPIQAGSPPNFAIPNADQPSSSTGVTEAIQNHVAALLKQPATTYKGHIKDDHDLALYKEAVWRAQRKENGIGGKCQGYPDDHAGKEQVVRRIFNAIHHTEGEQDPATEQGDFKNCVAVKAIKGLSDLETELLAYDLMEEMRKIQCGECVLCLPAEFNIVQEASFSDKLNQVVEALKYNKLLCRSATTTAEWIARIAADPVSERRRKVVNHRNNRGKSSVLRTHSDAKGTSRGKGKKRNAPDDSSDATTPSPSRPTTKRQRTSYKQANREIPVEAQAQKAGEAATPRRSPATQKFSIGQQRIIPQQPNQNRMATTSRASTSGRYNNNPTTADAKLTHTNQNTSDAAHALAPAQSSQMNSPGRGKAGSSSTNPQWLTGFDGHRSSGDTCINIPPSVFGSDFDFLPSPYQQQLSQHEQATDNGATPQSTVGSNSALSDDDEDLAMLQPVARWNGEN